MAEITKDEFFALAKHIKSKFGVNLGLEKKALVEGRLEKVLHKLNMPNVQTYFDFLKNDKTGKAELELVNAITTNHTFFMRETDHFKFYFDVVLPYWENTIRDNDMRTWCAACSSGEEAYTIAMLIKDFFVFKGQVWDTKILATDISLQALSNARQGIYSAEAVNSLPQKWRKIYFKQNGLAAYQVRSELKAEIIFRQFNLINKTFPFKKRFHTIFCRNVMIYFDLPTRRELINKFYNYLEPGGYLFIGHSEVIDRGNSNFKYVRPSVYRKE